MILNKAACDGSKDMAVILVRGSIPLSAPVKDTLKMLNLLKKHCCVVVKNTPQNVGMIIKVKDFITFGEIDAETKKALEEKRGIKEEDGQLKRFFRLAPPVGGFERKGIKKTFNIGGVLGYRGDKINALIKRML